MLEASVDQSLDGLALTREDLSRLVTDAKVTVEAHPKSDASPCHDTWLLIVEPLQVHHADFGLDAAFIGLAGRVRKRVRALLEEESEERTRLLPLLVRLRLADRDGSLATMLERSALVIDRKPEMLLPL